MNLRYVVLVAITALGLLAAVNSEWFSLGPRLTVYLRCDEFISGSLSVATVSQNGEQDSDDNFDIKTVCDVGKVEFGSYENEESLEFTFVHGDGETSEVVAEYGRDIQRDQSGFYTVLKITDAPPFIANSRI